VSPGNHVLDRGADPPWQRAISGEEEPIVNTWTADVSCERTDERNCGLGLTEGSTSSVVFVRWRQCAHTGRHIGATWRIRLSRPSAAALRSYVKLF